MTVRDDEEAGRARVEARGKHGLSAAAGGEQRLREVRQNVLDVVVHGGVAG